MDAFPPSRPARCARYLLTSLVLLCALRMPRAEELSPGIGDLYRWGEFDSLIRYLEPWLAARSVGADAREDTLAMARANLYLGVAYWASGKGELGDQAFRRACRLDSTLRMESLYATPEIAARFEHIRGETGKGRPGRGGNPPAARGAPKTSPGERSEVPPARETGGRGRAWKGWVIGGLGAAALLAGAGYAYHRLAGRTRPPIEVPVGSE